MNKQSGFTLIELIMVIVILGILAATAIPRFVDLSAEAGAAAAQGVAGALSAGAAINYAACSAGSSCTPVATCGDVVGTLQGGLSAGWAVDEPTDTSGCVVTDGTYSAPFSIIIAP